MKALEFFVKYKNIFLVLYFLFFFFAWFIQWESKKCHLYRFIYDLLIDKIYEKYEILKHMISNINFVVHNVKCKV
ncbi:hypothetical protein EHP00_1137 [Ecytonucleospora hepatopenaei]|uniref:Uncharacterized protein n=1 Tax=Ecytonucleospora hepatopenaei TaxID=646526 RepID=A0A1W0E4H7_9MICR|nr:hypothetical protein EHP00_1137 [Ecytonucleospora hepatopenaei]